MTLVRCPRHCLPGCRYRRRCARKIGELQSQDLDGSAVLAYDAHGFELFQLSPECVWDRD